MNLLSLTNIGLSNTCNNVNISVNNTKDEAKVDLSSINMADFSTMQNLFKTNNFQSMGPNAFKENKF
jgi:hypothetical protein